MTAREIARLIISAVRLGADDDGQATVDLIDAFVANKQPTGSSAEPIHNSETIDRFNQDLLALYQQEFPPGSDLAIPSEEITSKTIQQRHLLFLRFLYHLFPYLTIQRIVNDWWNLAIEPPLRTQLYLTDTTNECRTFTLDLLTSPDTEVVEDFRKRIFELYLHEESMNDGIPDNNLNGADLIEDNDEKKDDPENLKGSLYSSRIMHAKHEFFYYNLATILVNFGAVRTKNFFNIVNSYYIQSRYRLQVLNLLNEFVRRKRTHIHDMLESPLFDSMLRSLMLDNSTTLMAISVSTLIMLLPRICTSLPPFLPQLFYIFARAICWDQLRDSKKQKEKDIKGKEEEGDNEQANVVTFLGQRESFNLPRSYMIDGWDLLDYSISKLSAPPSNPRAAPLYTALYGLYPCNFIAFLNSPFSYLSEKGFVPPEKFDETVMRTRTIPLVERHILHEKLVFMDAATELVDTSRWKKMEPAEVVAECVSLDLTNAAAKVSCEQSVVKTLVKNEKESDSELWRDAAGLSADDITNDTNFTRNTTDNAVAELTKKTELDIGSKHARRQLNAVSLEEILELHRALKTGADILTGNDIWDSQMRFNSSVLSHSNEPSASELLPPTVLSANKDARALIASLQREVILLRNELNFEIFLKQQHLQHIGRLQRQHVLESHGEEELQQLYILTRSLKQEKQRLSQKLAQKDAETEKIKSKNINREREQNLRLAKYREEKKEWGAELEQVKEEYGEGKARLAVQSAQLEESRKKIFELESKLKVLEPQIAKLTESEQHIERLTKQLIIWEDDTRKFHEQREQMTILLSKWRGMQMAADANEQEALRLRRITAEQTTIIDELTIRLEEAKQNHYNNETNKLLLDRWLSEQDRKSKECERLRGEIEILKKKNEELESNLFTSNSELETALSRVGHTQASIPHEYTSPTRGSKSEPSSPKLHPQSDRGSAIFPHFGGSRRDKSEGGSKHGIGIFGTWR